MPCHTRLSSRWGRLVENIDGEVDSYARVYSSSNHQETQLRSATERTLFLEPGSRMLLFEKLPWLIMAIITD